MKRDTRLAHAGRHPELHNGAVNPPIYHVSTTVNRTVAEMRAKEVRPFDGLVYGRYGTPTSQAFEEAMCAIEGGYRTISAGSGLAAITATLVALLSAGDHLLMVDSCYYPTRRFCMEQLKRFGITTTFYDPLISADGLHKLMQDRTRVVFVEAPGSLTSEMQDIPALAQVAHHKKRALVVMDNTWATPLFYSPFEKGVDVSIHSCTKFIVGHSDAMLGAITCKDEAVWQTIKSSQAQNGTCAGAEEVYYGLRGLRTLGVRMRQHQESGLKLANWLQARPEVTRMMCPALPGDPGHAIWKRDFTGAPGLFGFELQPCPPETVTAFLDGMTYFALGYSWGGFESLIIPTTGAIARTAVKWKAEGPTLRIHTGLEDPDDLIEDLERAFERLAKAS